MVLPKCQDCKKKHGTKLNMVCQLCTNNSNESNSVFPCQEKLDKHLTSAHKESLEKEAKTEVVSQSKTTIEDHLVGVHEGKESQTCKKCNSEFCDVLELQNHINSEHKIQCPMCNKYFLDSNINKHIQNRQSTLLTNIQGSYFKGRITHPETLGKLWHFCFRLHDKP